MGRLRSLLSGVAVIVVAVLLVGCSSGATTESVAEPAPAAAQPSRDAELATLLDVDTSAVPDGATVDQLITIDEARAIIGVPDVFFAVPAG